MLPTREQYINITRKTEQTQLEVVYFIQILLCEAKRFDAFGVTKLMTMNSSILFRISFDDSHKLMKVRRKFGPFIRQ